MSRQLNNPIRTYCAIPKSAATSHSVTGKREPRGGGALYIPGEGWVKWNDLHAQVADAFRTFCFRRSMRNAATRERNAAAAAAKLLTRRAPNVEAAEATPTTRGKVSAPLHKTPLAAPQLSAA